MGPSLRFCMVTTFYPPYSFGGTACLCIASPICWRSEAIPWT
jgi:hypothetical protein